MLSSGVREILATTEAVIVDEIHAVAQTKRGSHLALTLERLDHLGAGRERRRSGVQRIGLSATQRPLERIAKFLVGPKRECRIVDAGRTKELDLEIVVPVEDMADPGAPAYPSEDGAPPTEIEPSAHVRSIWPAIYPKLLELVQEHTSTIIFVNNRRASERLAKRLNELANGEAEQELPATEHGGHGGGGLRRAAAGRLVGVLPRVPSRDRPRPPRLPLPRGAHPGRGDAEVGAAALPRRDLLPGAGDRHGRRRPGDPGRVAEVGDPRPAADRPRRARPRRGLQGPDLPQIPRRPARVRGRRPAHARRGDRGDGDPPEPARRARPAPGLDGRAGRVGGRRGRAPGHRHRALPRPLPRAAGERPRHARRPLPLRPLRRAAPADRLGPHRRHDPRPQRRPPAGRHQRRHDPRPRPLRRPPARRPPGRRARRGDGLRGPPGPDLPARRHHLADRGNHPRPGHRHPGPRRPRRRPLLEGRRDRPPGRAGPGDRRLRPRGGLARARPSWPPSTTSTPAPPTTSSPTCASSSRRPASSPPTRRSSSSASATRSATGASASSPPSAAASTPPGASPWPPRSAPSATSRPTRSGPTTASSSTSPTPTSRRPPTWS